MSARVSYFGARMAASSHGTLSVFYGDDVAVHFDLDKHALHPDDGNRVKHLFKQPDLCQDSWEVVHDELHIYKHDTGKFYTLPMVVIQIRGSDHRTNVCPWRFFSAKEKKRRERCGLTRPEAWEFTTDPHQVAMMQFLM